MKLTRRDFLKLTSVVLAGLILPPTVVLVSINEVNDPVIKRVQLSIRNLPEAFEGYRIAVLSDFHIYPYTTRKLVQKAIVLANSLKPDLGVYLGDYVWKDDEAIFDLAPILSTLNATDGIYSILGNHDYWLNVETIKKGLLESRIPVLINQGISLNKGSGLVNLIGLDDGWSGNPDLKTAAEGLPGEAPAILLLHEPDLADRYSFDPRIFLQLSGHTHGGQVRINNQPIISPYLGEKYNLGLYQVGKMWLYTNGGIGTISVPLRYNCPPEVTEITLFGG